MELSLNCIFLGNTSLKNIFIIDIGKKTVIDNVVINIEVLKVTNLKYLILDKKKDMLQINDYDSLDLWKVDIADEEENLKDLKDNIEKIGSWMKPNRKLREYFPSGQKLTDKKIHIIVQAPTIGKYLPMFYLSNKKFCNNKISIWSDLFFVLFTRATFVISFLFLYNQHKKL
jgi:hypothetical protein